LREEGGRKEGERPERRILVPLMEGDTQWEEKAEEEGCRRRR